MSQDELMDTFRKGRPKQKTRNLPGGHPRPIMVSDEQAKLIPPPIPEVPDFAPTGTKAPDPEPSFKQVAQDEATYRAAQRAKVQTRKPPTPKRRK
jgi:hypothetical protein